MPTLTALPHVSSVWSQSLQIHISTFLDKSRFSIGAINIRTGSSWKLHNTLLVHFEKCPLRLVVNDISDDKHHNAGSLPALISEIERSEIQSACSLHLILATAMPCTYHVHFIDMYLSVLLQRVAYLRRHDLLNLNCLINIRNNPVNKTDKSLVLSQILQKHVF